MVIIIVGGGRTGLQLARLLLTQNQDVRVIEDHKEILSVLHRELPTEVILEGNPMFPETLEEAGIEQADALAACTADDSVNLVLCHFVREKYKIRRTISRVNNPRNAWLFNHAFGVDVALNQAEILATLIQEEISLGDMMTLLKLKRGKYSLIEERIDANAPAVGVTIKDLDLPQHCVISAIIRNGEVMIPRGLTVLAAGDEILALIEEKEARQLSGLLTDPAKKSHL